MYLYRMQRYDIRLTVLSFHPSRHAFTPPLPPTPLFNRATNLILTFMALEESCRSANNAVLVALMNTGDGREALLALFGGVFEQTCPGGAGLDLGDLGPGMGRVRADVVYENPDMAGAAHALG